MPSPSSYRPRFSEREIYLLRKALERQVKDYHRLAQCKTTEAARSRAERLAWEHTAMYDRLTDRTPGNPHHRQLSF